MKTDPMGLSEIGGYAHNVGRTAHADVLAAAINFLASDAASNISGAIPPVDNGWSAI